ncbi:PREDICTED: TITAN-like protein isoform X3 [Ipomoea nil]|uniref:TITAN-like protein isoform X1 n=1 Tax=Ipomoea nil TaxID=35883 RepID=UPI00090107F6|nr:PREDICTED: TITAN-like protein isoform X1 [Ipomoea nil]XP_019176559.1 PREDICTED: TITAN-like protein isoform X1 [Ipomoea nil]XP_019176560.1 PREDICTED: TITAN-like protein isoform X2 [Ipomoea nil]XP_019176561.1 PREDICTED: TITAN-like protein isoform X3 [Ipomoea nil]
MKKKKKSNEGFEFCEVCKLNHNQGRRHNFFPNHKKSLEAALSRFRSKLADLRSSLKNPTPLRPEHASLNRLWCRFCQFDIPELHSFFNSENAIAHLASEDHLKKVKRFLWKYGGGMDKIDCYRITEADFAKWEKQCKALKTEAAGEGSHGPLIGPSNDIHNKMNSDYVNSFGKDNIHAVNVNISNSVVPLQNYTNERSQIYNSELPVTQGGCPHLHHSYACLSCHPPVNGFALPDERTAKGETTSLGLPNLTKISSAVQEDILGNVHSGAPPPWLNAIEQNQLEFVSNSGENDLYYLSQKRKSSKLNPKRVGAAWAERRKREMELEKKGELVMNKADANWLPNFGRVWQSGSRKESRKEFQIENKISGKIGSQSTTVVQLQPYISKRMRKDSVDGALEQPTGSE